MSCFVRRILLCLLLLGASAGVATPAHAITFTPAAQAITGAADRPELRYGRNTAQCETGTFTGTTANPANARLSVRVDFSRGCLAFGAAATVECRGEVTLEATSADGRGGGSGAVNLDSNFQCSLIIRGVCTVTFRGVQRGLRSWRYTPGARVGTLEARVAGIVGREDAPGSIICPNEDRNASLTASYETTPGVIGVT
jgi:hypothetical protein